MIRFSYTGMLLKVTDCIKFYQSGKPDKIGKYLYIRLPDSYINQEVHLNYFLILNFDYGTLDHRRSNCPAYYLDNSDVQWLGKSKNKSR